jgi:Rieske Fe-S protein
MLPRADGEALGRRDFCQGALASAVLVSAGCGAAGTNGTNLDMAPGGDGGSSSDLGCNTAGSCPAGAVDSGMMPAAILLGKVYVISGTKYAVIRDAGGLFATDLTCTHRACTVAASTGTPVIFNCPCHGSQYTLGGAVMSGPATVPLQHYAICLTTKGTVAVAPATFETLLYRFCG